MHGDPLLHLQTAGEDFHQASDFAQSDDLAFGDIGDVHFAKKGQHVVLAQAEHLNVLYDHHFVIVNAEQRALQDLLRVLAIAFGEILQRLGVTLRCLQQAFALGLFAQADQHLAHQFVEAGAGDGRSCDQVFHKSAISI